MKRTSPSLMRLLSLFTCALIIQCQLSASLAFTTADLAFGKRANAASPNAGDVYVEPQGSASTMPTATFSNSSSFTIADRAGGAQPPGVASLYPSPISVSGMAGSVSDINVTIFGLTATRPRDLDFLLVSPTGEKFVIIADVGGLCAVSNVDITLDDSAATLLADSASPAPCAPVITSGSYRPTNYIFGVEVDTFPAPAPTGPYNHAAPSGGSSFASSFNGIAPNGNWNLYAVDDSLGGGVSSVGGGWSIEVTTDENVAITTTSIQSSANPALTTTNITFTATVTSGGNPVAEGAVSFANNGVAIAGCTGVAVDGSGQAQCVTMLSEGTRTISAHFGGTASFGMSNASLSQVVNSPTVINGAQFCNNGGITIVDPPGGSTPYPSNIAVSGLFGTVGTVSVDLNGLTSPRPNNLDFLLVGPGGQAFLIMSDVGDAATAASGINLALTDSAPGLMPIGTPLSGGTYRPTDSAVIGQPDLFPPPAPGSYSLAAPAGSATFGSVYGGTQPNGTWSLYSIDDSVGGGASSLTGWCVNFTVSPVATTTALVSSLNPSNFGDSVTFTATVSSSAGTPSGTVEFFDGVTSLGTDTLDGAGEATLTTSALTSGSHNITANYLGASVGAGGGGYAASTSNTVVQVVRTAPTANPDAYATNEDQPLNVAAPGVLGNDTDPDPGATLTAVLVSGPSNAQAFVLNADGSFSYTPNPNFFGPDSFTYKARDNTNLDSNTVTVSITVNAVDDGPEVTVSGGGSCGGGAASGTINLTVSDSDTPAGSLTLSATSSNTTLVPNANITFGGSGANRTMTVVATAPGTVQNSTITITVSDGSESGTTTVTVIVGTTMADNITGTSGADMIWGRQDTDTINAGGGNDLVCGGAANDVINGGSGNDTLNGEHGDDTLRGDDGNDVLLGDSGADTLEGGNDDDTLTGGSGADSFSGGPGTDTATDFNPGGGDTQDGSLGWLIPTLKESAKWLTAD